MMEPRPISRLALSHLPLLALLVASVACAGGNSATTASLARVGEPAPDFELSSLTGEKVSLASLEGKVVLLDFWATWCGPCHEQARILKEVHEGVSRDRTEFLAVNSGEEPETVQRFASRSPFPYPVILDPKDELGTRLGVIALPTLVIIDAAGHVSFKGEGIIAGDVVERELAKAGGG